MKTRVFIFVFSPSKERPNLVQTFFVYRADLEIGTGKFGHDPPLRSSNWSDSRIQPGKFGHETLHFGCRFYRTGWTSGCKFEFLYGFGLSAGSKIHFGGVSRKWISKSADSGIGEFGHDKRGRILKLDGLSKVWTRSRTHAVPILKSAKVWTIHKNGELSKKTRPQTESSPSHPIHSNWIFITINHYNKQAT